MRILSANRSKIIFFNFHQQIIIIEYPHPEVQQAVNDAIAKYFIESTVLIIGLDKSQFAKCHRVVDLSERQDAGF